MFGRQLVVMLVGFFLFTVAGPVDASTQMRKKVDNFLILVDSSGSMDCEYQDTGMTRMEMAKKTLQAMNRKIPELDYQGALYTIAPYAEFRALTPYKRGEYAGAIDAISTDIVKWGFIGNPTTLGEGMEKVRTASSGFQGQTAVILLSDGGQNKGIDPVKVARAMTSREMTPCCFYIVSFAESRKEQAILEELASVTDCSGMVRGSDLADPVAMDSFVKTVFYSEVAEPDSDGDGVPDSIDQCPDTPMGVKVDAVGCPLDSDHDGVPDYLDECPDTPAGVMVDEKGCPMMMELGKSVYYQFDSDVIQPQYTEAIDEVGKLMKAQPAAEAVLEGNACNIGPAEYNMGLSIRRAESVKMYLMDKFGIEAERLKVVGFGEDKPVGDNETREGRMKNRRVDIVIPEEIMK